MLPADLLTLDASSLPAKYLDMETSGGLMVVMVLLSLINFR